MLDMKLVGDALVVLIVAGKGVLDWRGGQRRDRKHTSLLDTRFSTLDLSLEQRFNGITREVAEVRSEVREVRAFVVGPDGENGIRGDIREVKARVIGLEERERDRLHGTYDRRS